MPAWSRGAEEPSPQEELEAVFVGEIKPLLSRCCVACHGPEHAEADIDLEAFATAADVRRAAKLWQQIERIVASRQMPPPEAEQLSAEQRQRLLAWIRAVLLSEAAKQAGDPGPVVLRRLNNAQYRYTIQDLTGVTSLDPVREFPADGAAGEGFTNVGNALGMSPALVSKYLEAARQTAAHAVLLPDGFRFSPATTRRDWTNEALARVRAFYGRYCRESDRRTLEARGADPELESGRSLPWEEYFAALLETRAERAAGRTDRALLARQRGLSAKYLTALEAALETAPSDPPAPPFDALRARWRTAEPADAAALVRDVTTWHGALWKLNPVGHIGRPRGPKSWLEPVDPLTARQNFAAPLRAKPGEAEIVLYLSATDAGDGGQDDRVIWERPRLVAPGRPEVLLRDLRQMATRMAQRRRQLAEQAEACLAAAHEAYAATNLPDVAELAARRGVDPIVLRSWLAYLGIGPAAADAAASDLLTQPRTSVGGHDFVAAWTGDDDLSVVANASDQPVRIPGELRPHGVCVHPAPTRAAGVGWRSPLAARVRIEGRVQRAHPECGDDVAWAVELRRGGARLRLVAGVAKRAEPVSFGPLAAIDVRPGDAIALVVAPRDGDHACGLTAVDLTIATADGPTWDLAAELSGDLLAGNPHADHAGRPGVWQMFSEPTSGWSGDAIPPDSLLARWQASGEAGERAALAAELQRLLREGAGGLAAEAPDAVLVRQLLSLGGPLLSAAMAESAAQPGGDADRPSTWGLSPDAFGVCADGTPIDPASLCVEAPAVVEVRLPAELVDGYALATSATLAPGAAQGSVQASASTAPPSGEGLQPGAPILVLPEGAARRRWEAGLSAMRRLFPPALCYGRIVPIDEAVTLTLFYREDERLRELVLDDAETAELNRLWDELLYVAREPLELATAFAQITEFATQDRPDLVVEFADLRAPIAHRAAAFRQRLVDDEPRQLAALADFAKRAFRRPLTVEEADRLTAFYRRLREEGTAHEEAFGLTLTRVLAAPDFLYRAEEPGAGAEAAPVGNHALATRLSYFLWSSAPDDELRAAADAGRLAADDALRAQTRRMLADPKVRRLATEFACQWLHLVDFDRTDEKSERHFPSFAALRGPMYEETIRFFTDLFQNDGSVLDILGADYALLNEELAAHYAIPGVQGPEWRRVDRVRAFGRGGILTHASALAKQSGASRTSPILRGTWISETLLGEPTPRPPKNVPPLAETAPEGLTERQLTERHATDPACQKCHQRIDPFGFALEGYDAIGRSRREDAAGLPIDSATTLPDGTRLAGWDDLRRYLLTTGREAFLRQFNRKLLGFALGREVALSDEPLLVEMRTALEANDFAASAAVEKIVLSRQFREIRGREAPADAEVAAFESAAAHEPSEELRR
jgi:hypothetical protein